MNVDEERTLRAKAVDGDRRVPVELRIRPGSLVTVGPTGDGCEIVPVAAGTLGLGTRNMARLALYPWRRLFRWILRRGPTPRPLVLCAIARFTCEPDRIIRIDPQWSDDDLVLEIPENSPLDPADIKRLWSGKDLR